MAIETKPEDPAPALLMATTVATTHGFLLPFAEHFRALGWRVDGCAAGITSYEPATNAYDSIYDIPLSRSLKDVHAIGASFAALRRVLGQGYDIVHVHTPIAAFVARAMVRRIPIAQRPCVAYTAHGFHFHEGGHPLSNALFLTAERVAGRWTDGLVVINAEDREAARRHKIVPRRHLHYMPGIGVDTTWYARAALEPGATRTALTALGMDPGRPYFVTVGEFSRRKRPTDVVRALARMKDHGVGLLLLGDGPERARVEAVASECGVADRVFAPGKVTDIRPYVAAALALIQASSREGLPRSMMEALSLETPLIATSARGHLELVGDDRGRVVPIGGIDELASAMDRLVQDAGERAAMGQRGRRLMVERYDTAIIIEAHEDLYGEMLAERAQRRAHGVGTDG